MSEPTADSKQGNRFARPAKVQEDPVTKALKVKTGTLKRNVKDLAFARNELQKEEARLEKIASEDPDKIQQQKNVIGESAMMIPLAENRIRASLEDLKEFLKTTEGVDGELKEAADSAIAEAEALF